MAVSASKRRFPSFMSSEMPTFLRRIVDGPAISLVVVIVAVIIWEMAVGLTGVRGFILPAPSAIAANAWNERALVAEHTAYTVWGIASGYAVASIFALAVAMAMIQVPVIERILMPIFVALESVPKIAIAPLILLWIGTGLVSQLLVIVSVTFFPIVINAVTGFKNVDRGLINVFRSIKTTRRQTFFRLQLPYALPYVFAGLRIATTLSVLGAIVAEWLAASRGVGYLILSGSFNFNTARSFTAIIVLAAIGMIFFSAISALERRFSWRVRQERDATASTK
jgi:ABC-type nitrate/sulfonate/bicarbonate transport system permease component